ncbi:MAG: hypothetical protein WCF93_04805 [Candidatus Moraniibacteriota bacterium]
MQLEKIFHSFGLSASLAELVTVLLVMLAIAVILWLVVGKKRLHNSVMNIYLSFALVQVLPTDLISTNKNLPVLVFLSLVILLTLIGKYTFDIGLSGSGLAYWQIFLMSFLEVGAIFSISVSFLGDKQLLQYVSKDALFYFTSPWAKFSWLAMPLLFLIYINKSND